MKKEVIFMPLGGGQRVGASCYYLKLGDNNIILDAGTGRENGIVFEPKLQSLLTPLCVESMGQINQIYISHAHIDHIGYLTKLIREAPRANIYMTEITKLFCEYQLYDREYLLKKGNENKRLETQIVLDKITKISFMQKIKFKTYSVSFFPAGHIPGAMMTLFRFGGRNILYTGDYSIEKTAFTDGCILPDNLHIDTLIMCGLHAKHPEYVKKSDVLFQLITKAVNYVEKRNISVLCYVPQLSKGVEFIKTLNDRNVNNIPVYIDKSVMNVVNKMERLSAPILNENNKIMDYDFPDKPHIYVTSSPSTKINGFYMRINVDFSLHEDFSQMKKFIKKINPKQVVMVHCAKPYRDYDKTIEQELIMDGECRTQFIFAEEELYKI